MSAYGVPSRKPSAEISPAWISHENGAGPSRNDQTRGRRRVLRGAREAAEERAREQPRALPVSHEAQRRERRRRAEQEHERVRLRRVRELDERRREREQGRGVGPARLVRALRAREQIEAAELRREREAARDQVEARRIERVPRGEVPRVLEQAEAGPQQEPRAVGRGQHRRPQRRILEGKRAQAAGERDRHVDHVRLVRVVDVRQSVAQAREARERGEDQQAEGDQRGRGRDLGAGAALHARAAARTAAATRAICSDVSSGYSGRDRISAQAFSATGNWPTRPRRAPRAG